MKWIKKNFKLFKLFVDSIRVRLAGLFLPRDCYVQQIPAKIFQDDDTYFRKTFRKNRKFLSWTLSDPNRAAIFTLLLRENAKLNSNVAELGTFQGKTARILFEHLQDREKLFIFDTFEGFDAKDVNIEKSIGVETKAGHFSNTSISEVNREITGNGNGHEQLVCKKGYFPDTFEGLENLSWRFVHLDADLYNPIKSGLDMFYPKLLPGGIILVHDYGGHYEGAKKAVDEFVAKENNITLIPMCDKVGSALIVKNK